MTGQRSAADWWSIIEASMFLLGLIVAAGLVLAWLAGQLPLFWSIFKWVNAGFWLLIVGFIVCAAPIQYRHYKATRRRP
jgi:signal transduction histidine kinase